MKRATLKPLRALKPATGGRPGARLFAGRQLWGRQLSARQLGSRLAAVLLLLAVILLLQQAVVDPILQSLQDSRDAIADAATRLSRIKAIAATKPELEKLAAKMASDMGHSDAFLRADTEALAGAALQERLRQLTGAQGISLGAIQWAGGRTESGLGRISVRVQVTTTIGPLYELLGQVEATMPLLFIDDIDIQASGSSDPGQPQQAGPLSVSFECYGYWLGPEGTPPTAPPASANP
jgi:general secretion pathway protein M